MWEQERYLGGGPITYYGVDGSIVGHTVCPAENLNDLYLRKYLPNFYATLYV